MLNRKVKNVLHAFQRALIISVHQRRKSRAADSNARGRVAVVCQGVAGVGHGQGHSVPPLPGTFPSGPDLEGKFVNSVICGMNNFQCS